MAQTERPPFRRARGPTVLHPPSVVSSWWRWSGSPWLGSPYSMPAATALHALLVGVLLSIHGDRAARLPLISPKGEVCVALADPIPPVVLDPEPPPIRLDAVRCLAVPAPEAERPKEEKRISMVSVSFPTSLVARVEGEVAVTLDGEELRPLSPPVVAKASSGARAWAAEAVRAAILQRLHYPESCRRRGEEGTVRLRLRIGAEGDLLDLHVEGRLPRLAEAARRAALDAAPFAAMGECISLEIPIAFRLTP